jgi:hypothetical protein
MVIGCSGDESTCGNMYFREMIFLSNDVSAVSGLPTQIYNALIAS